MDSTEAKDDDSSIFRDFLICLRDHWRTNLSSITPVKVSLGPTMGTTHTFYAGVARSSSLHTYLVFQHNSKAWKVGQFTINVVLVKHAEVPNVPLHQFSPETGLPSEEGSYRIGGLLSRRDKWWHLRDYDGKLSRFADHWFAKKYDDSEKVLVDAVANVTSDVLAVLKKLEVTPNSSNY